VSERRRLIVVSNRGPVTYSRAESGRVARRGGGGLVTALAPLVSLHDVTWVANALSEEDRAVAVEAGGAFEETGRDGSRYRLRLVRHDPGDFGSFYNEFANPALWFLQHEMAELVEPPSQGAWESYGRVNATVAAAVLEELEEAPNTAVWFHDYHLYLAPAAVRAARPDATLSHFVHIPWPRPEGWGLLPAEWSRALHEGLLANDVVGFHTHRWRDRFLDSVAAILGEVDLPLVTAHPISVDPREFDELARSAEVLVAGRELERIRCERTVLRVDRTDPTKNIVRGFEAFGLYLERHPEAHGRVGMLAHLDPSRQEIPQYAAYLDAVVDSARAVNERYGREGWLPIRLEIEDDFPRSVAAYAQYDVLLVNAVSDGLNLVAKEAPLVNERNGVVVLSENAGAWEELGRWVVTVDPLDVEGQAEAIHQALELPETERAQRAEAIRAYVREHDLGAWLRAQLADLDRVSAAA
jgi:trehalose 6-phosphate synthase